MDARRESEPTPMKNGTTVERKSERELVTTRTFNGPARIVFEAWTKPELFKQWWVPKSLGMSLSLSTDRCAAPKPVHIPIARCEHPLVWPRRQRTPSLR